MILKNFIVFEGIDGAGTTTQLKKLADFIPEDKLFLTAEPTKNETGLFLRRMLKGEFKIDEKTAAYLFAADRCEHIYGQDGVIEQLNKGKIVASDRYFFSSLAYQSVSVGEELPSFLNSPFPLPEILFYFVINPEISLGRVMARSEAKDNAKTSSSPQIEIYEKLDIQKNTADWYEKIISSYEKDETKLYSNDKDIIKCDKSVKTAEKMKIVRIDATLSIEEIAEKIKLEIQNINKK